MFVFLMLTAFIFFLIFGRLVAEKVRDIGALRALGASPAGIRNCFLMQGLFIAAVGTILGLGLAEGILHGMNPALKAFNLKLFAEESLAAGEIPYAILSFDRMLITGLTLFMGWVGAFFPAWSASRKNPVECLRHE